MTQHILHLCSVAELYDELQLIVLLELLSCCFADLVSFIAQSHHSPSAVLGCSGQWFSKTQNKLTLLHQTEDKQQHVCEHIRLIKREQYILNPCFCAQKSKINISSRTWHVWEHIWRLSIQWGSQSYREKWTYTPSIEIYYPTLPVSSITKCKFKLGFIHHKVEIRCKL